MRHKYVVLFWALLLCILMTAHSGLFAGKYAITNAIIIPVSSDTLKQASLVMEGDKIVAIGQNVKIPADAEIIDATGLYVYPGMIDAASVLGLSEIGSISATQDAFEMGQYNPHIKTSVAINPHSVHIPITRVNGITSAVVIPAGGVISGQCSLINLSGWTIDDMLIQEPVGILINFPRVPSQSRRPRRGQTEAASSSKKTMEQINELKELFHKTKRYKALWERYERDKVPPAPEKNMMYEALVPVIEKKVPVIISVRAEKDIKNAIEFVKELDLKAILLGADDGWKVADLLSKNKIPVLVGPVLQTPGSKDPYDARFANAAVLRKAGVKIAFLSGSAADARNLPYQAAMAAAFGLPKEEALKAVTLYPAEIFGLSDTLGSLEVGKMANVIVTTGDPLQVVTQVKYLFIAGEKVSLETRHTKLYEKFSGRPTH